MNYAKLVSMISSYCFSTGNVPEPCMIPYPVSTHVKPCTNMEASTNSIWICCLNHTFSSHITGANKRELNV